MSAIKEALYNLGEMVTKLEHSLDAIEQAKKNNANNNSEQVDMFSSPEQKQAVVNRLDSAIEQAEELLNEGVAQHG